MGTQTDIMARFGDMLSFKIGVSAENQYGKNVKCYDGSVFTRRPPSQANEEGNFSRHKILFQ